MSDRRSAPVTSIHVPYTAKQKMYLHGACVRFYDFVLEAEHLSMEDVDLNTMWLSCGRNPEQHVCGVWLLAPGDRVVAYHDRLYEKYNTFNAEQRKTYARLFFVEDIPKPPLYSPMRAPTLRVRVAIRDRRSSDLSLLVCGFGDTFDYSRRGEFDDRLKAYKWIGNRTAEQFFNMHRWTPTVSPLVTLQPPRAVPRQSPVAAAPCQKEQYRYEPSFRPPSPGYTPDEACAVYNERNPFSPPIEDDDDGALDMYDPSRPSMF